MGQEMQRRPSDPTALFATHGELIALGFVRLARFHFDKNDGRILRCDQIDLPGEAAVIAGEDAIAPMPQIPGRGPLALDAQREVRARRPTPPA